MLGEEAAGVIQRLAGVGALFDVALEDVVNARYFPARLWPPHLWRLS